MSKREGERPEIDVCCFALYSTTITMTSIQPAGRKDRREEEGISSPRRLCDEYFFFFF